jgi:hypothetical protein
MRYEYTFRWRDDFGGENRENAEWAWLTHHRLTPAEAWAKGEEKLKDNEDRWVAVVSVTEVSFTDIPRP